MQLHPSGTDYSTAQMLIWLEQLPTNMLAIQWLSQQMVLWHLLVLLASLLVELVVQPGHIPAQVFLLHVLLGNIQLQGRIVLERALIVLLANMQI
jgi:hypothetical protein